jgi:glycosyltransferase involved in cell wall biosynthesis
MKLLHVTPFYEPYWAYGGMARSSSALCRALARRGHEVTVATALLEPGPSPDETLGGVRVRRFAGPSLMARMLTPWARGLREFLAAELPSTDVVHLHGFRNGLAVTASRILEAAGRRFVLTTHGGFPDHGQFRVVKAIFDRAIGTRIVQDAAMLLAVSEGEARDLPRRARVIPNGVEPCGSARRSPTRGRGRILFVGTDRPQKRGQILPSLLASLPETELHLVGRFGVRFLRALAPFRERVKASGVLSGQTLADAYADADVLVHPAVGEAFGLVPFEAALTGTPAVVAGGHGCGEWYERAGGCVVPPDDVPVLVEAVHLRLSDPRRAEEEVRLVARFAREHLTWDRAASATERVYQEMLRDEPTRDDARRRGDRLEEDDEPRGADERGDHR